MVNVARHSGDKTYSHGTVVVYVRKLVNEAARVCSKSTDINDIFAVLNKVADANWLKQMLANAERDFQKRAIETGKAMKEGAHPLGPGEVSDIVESYAREGSRESVL